MAERERLSLDGEWTFWVDPQSVHTPATLDSTEARSINVPAPWQSQAADLRHYFGDAWYRRTIEIPADWLRQRLILGFGAVDYYAQLWLNDVKVAEHEGGYLPFEVDITEVARPGKNMLTVKVSDGSNLFPEIPHGKQSWYGPLSGIWQPVWLERRAPLHTRSMRLFPDLHTGEIRAKLSLSDPAGTGCEAVAEITGPDGSIVASARSDLPADRAQAEISLTVPAPRAWSPDAPHLYRLEVQLIQQGERQDRASESFGFRTIEARDGQLLLNGEPIYLRGALDQDYYPGTIATPPSTDFLEAQFRQAKALGLNCLRCHIKIPDPRYYEVADRVGLLIWTELPNWHTFTDRVPELVRETLQGIVERDGNHPSIIAWTIINEDWGTRLMHDPAHRAWLKESYRWLKELDPTRLVVDNSPCHGNFHVQSDLDDYHYYKAIPDHRLEWDKFVNLLAARLAPTYSPYGDAVRTGKEPIILSEFGNWGLPDVEKLLDEAGEEPWWFETGLEWGDGVVYPAGVRKRFKQWNLDRVFGSWQAFIEATQWQQYEALKYEIESMRRRPAISGYVITEFTDVHWECNGLLDMERNPKSFHAAFNQVNRDTVIVPERERAAYWSGEPVSIDLTVAHGAGPAIERGEIQWRLSADATAGQLPVPSLEAGQAVATEAVTFMAPEVGEPTSQELELELRNGDNGTLSRNHLPVTVFPRRRGPARPETTLWTADPSLSKGLQRMGYRLATDPGEADAIILDRLDDAAVTFLREGGRILLLADSSEALGPGFLNMNVVPRDGTLWRGDWASSFAWLRRDGPFARLPGGPLLDHTFDCVMPDHVIRGLRHWDFEHQAHAGLFVGWIHKVVALIAQRRYGKGHLVLTTFRILDRALDHDPVTTILFDALVDLAVEPVTSHP